MSTAQTPQARHLAADAAPDTVASDTSETSAPRAIISHLKNATFDQGLREFFEYRDLGVAQATGGAYCVHVIRALSGHEASGVPHLHRLDFQFVYVLQGWVEFEYEQTGKVRLEQGDSVYQPPGIRHREMRHSADLQMLEVVSPTQFPTVTLEQV